MSCDDYNFSLVSTVLSNRVNSLLALVRLLLLFHILEYVKTSRNNGGIYLGAFIERKKHVSKFLLQLV